MVVLKKQFDSKGNLVLQAVVEDEIVKSVRRFEPNGHELAADTESFELTVDGTIQFKGMVKTASKPDNSARSLSEMYDEFKTHEVTRRPAENYEKRTNAVSGMKMTEQAFGDLGSAMEELQNFAFAKFNESVKKVQDATEALRGNGNGKTNKEGVNEEAKKD